MVATISLSFTDSRCLCEFRKFVFHLSLLTFCVEASMEPTVSHSFDCVSILIRVSKVPFSLIFRLFSFFYVECSVGATIS